MAKSKAIGLFVAALLASGAAAQEQSNKHGVFKIRTPDGSTGTAFVVAEPTDGIKLLLTAAHVTEHPTLPKSVYAGDAYPLLDVQDKEVSKATVVVVDAVNDVSLLRASIDQDFTILDILDVPADAITLTAKERVPCRIWGFGNGKWTETTGFSSFFYKDTVYNDCVGIPGQSGGPLIVDGKVAGLLSGGMMWYEGTPAKVVTWPARCCAGRRLREIIERNGK